MLPADDKLRKEVRAFQGFVKYFPDAIALVAVLSKIANEQHNPGQPMHWAKEKSKDELDSLMNHLMDIACKGELSQDADGVLDAIKVAWRGMANLQRLADKFGLDTLMYLMKDEAEEVSNEAAALDCLLGNTDEYEIEVGEYVYPFVQDTKTFQWVDQRGQIVPPQVLAAVEAGR